LSIGILGTLSIVDKEGREWSPAALKQRVLLASLLTSHNRVIPVDDLMGWIWPETMPKTGRTAIQVYVSSLRKLFTRASLMPNPLSIVTHSGGYMIKVLEEKYDLARFTAYLRNARQAEARGDLKSASQFLDRAIACWRGPALSDIRVTPRLEAEARRLEELRISALERRFHIDLSLGKETDIVGEIYSATVQYPFHEKFCCYLMTALHRQGRPADALRAYSDFRSAIQDQLGLEPSVELKRIQRSILVRGSTSTH